MTSKDSLPKKTSFSERLKRLQSLLQKSSVELYLVENPIDLFYLTGLEFSTGSLFIHEKEIRLFVDGRYIEQAQANSSLPTSLLSENEILAHLERLHPKELYFDSDNTSYLRYTKLDALAQKTKASIKVMPQRSLVQQLRLIKDDGEKELLRKSAKLNWMGYKHILSLLKEGISEKELALEFEIFCKRNGAEKLSFDPIIAFGANSSRPHHRSSDTKLKKNDIVLIDIGVILSRYCSDMTRVVFFGHPDPELKDIFAVVREAQKAALALCKPGVRLEELDQAARDVMKKAKREELYLHSLGHGLGLEIHEHPRIKVGGEDKDLILQEGMAITIEPGLYLSGKGGARYEDTILITQEGYENLYPQEE